MYYYVPRQFELCFLGDYAAMSARTRSTNGEVDSSDGAAVPLTALDNGTKGFVLSSLVWMRGKLIVAYI